MKGIKSLRELIKMYKSEYRLTKRLWSEAVHHGHKEKASDLFKTIDIYRTTIYDLKKELRK